MKKLMLIAVGAAMLLAAPLSASAQAGPPMGQPGDRHQSETYRTGMDRSGDRHDQRSSDSHNNRYGRWENNWGARPMAPPRRFTNQRSWYKHVRACQLRYRSYNARTDLYTLRRGVMVRCRL